MFCGCRRWRRAKRLKLNLFPGAKRGNNNSKTGGNPMANRERRANELIHCENCGEDYAATYRCCPFCEERPTRGRGGGARLKNNTRGGGYGGPPSPLRVLGWVLSLALIIAACVIVFHLLGDLLGFSKDKEDPPPSSPPVESSSPSALPSSDPSAPPTTDPTPTPTSAPPPSGVTGITFKNINSSLDVTLKAGEQLTFAVSVTPGSWGGTVVWSTDNADVATVSETGVVTNVNAGANTAVAHITATAEDKSVTCIVRCRGGSGGTATPTPGETTSVTAVTLNKTDFTIRPQDSSTYQLQASGGDGSYSWSSSNTNVATVSDSGLVTKVGKGTCTITCTSGGSSATCTVRIS